MYVSYLSAWRRGGKTNIINVRYEPQVFEVGSRFEHKQNPLAKAAAAAAAAAVAIFPNSAGRIIELLSRLSCLALTIS